MVSVDCKVDRFVPIVPFTAKMREMERGREDEEVVQARVTSAYVVSLTLWTCNSWVNG